MRSLIILFVFSPLLLLGQLDYTDMTIEAGLSSAQGTYGISISDFDGDGAEDLLLIRQEGPNLLYRNSTDGNFQLMKEEFEVGSEVISKAAVWGDTDNDGDQDVFVGVENGAHQFFVNNGDGTFSNTSTIAQVEKEGRCTSTNMADVNGDGLLDIYVANQSLENNLFINLGNNIFEDQVDQRNAGDLGSSQGAIFLDFDNDGDQDLFLARDNDESGILYENDGLGFFSDISAASGIDQFIGHSKGVDIGDFNRDGHFDIYLAQQGSNLLLSGNSIGTFEAFGNSLVNDAGLGWSTVMADINNDGWEDIYCASDFGIIGGTHLLMQNNAGIDFENASQNSVLSGLYLTRGLAYFDSNQDGLLELVLGNYGINDPIQFFSNETSNTQNWLQVKLEGVPSNRDAIGARVEFLDADEKIQMKAVTAGNAYVSQSSKVLHFGLGDQTAISEITIYWPSGNVENIANPPTNKRISIKEGQGIVNGVEDPNSGNGYSVGPNPTADSWNIRFDIDEARIIQLRLFDIQGRLIHDKGIEKFSAGEYAEVLDIPGKGTFIAHLLVDGESFSWRIIKH